MEYYTTMSMKTLRLTAAMWVNHTNTIWMKESCTYWWFHLYKVQKQAKLIYATGSSHDDYLRGVIKRELKEGAGDISWSESW